MPVGEWAPQADEAGTALRVLAWRAAFADGAAPGGFAAVAGGLCVAPSRLPGAGHGLFAARRGAARKGWAWRARDVVCVYEGSVLATKSALRVEDKSYLMRLGPQARAATRPVSLSVACAPLSSVLARRSSAHAARQRASVMTTTLGSQVYVDAREHPGVLARYINDPRNAAACNVTLDKRPAERCVSLSCVPFGV